MATMIENLGLDSIMEDEQTLKGFMGFVASEGKVFPGYSNAKYIYKDTGSCEFWLHTVPNDEEKRLEVKEIHTHGGNMNLWKMRHIGIDVSPKNASVLERIAMFELVDEPRGMLPIDIFNADVLPSLMEGDEITVQIIGYPLDVNYYKDKAAYSETIPNGKYGKKCIPAVGSLLPLSFLGNHSSKNYDKDKDYESDRYVFFTGEVKKLYHGTFEIGENCERTYIRCLIDTNFGELELDHTFDQVTEELRENIRVGSIVSGVCILSGDVAIDEYKNGAIKDFDHDLRALRYAFAEGYAEKLLGILKEESAYISEASKTTLIGVKDIVERIKAVHESENDDDKIYAHLATIVSVDDQELEYPAGTRCIVLASGEEDNYVSIAFIEVDENGLIDQIKFTIDGGYHFRIDEPGQKENFFEDMKMPESVEKAIEIRARFLGLLPDEDEDFLDKIKNYETFKDAALKVLEAIKSESNQENIERLSESAFGYLFAKAAESIYNRARENNPSIDTICFSVETPETKETEITAKLMSSYNLDDVLNDTITASIPSKEMDEKLAEAMDEGKRFFIDFRNYYKADQENADELFVNACIVVQALGEYYGKRFFLNTETTEE